MRLIDKPQRNFWKILTMKISLDIFIIGGLAYLYMLFNSYIFSPQTIAPFIILILLIPIYQIVIDRRDSIHFIEVNTDDKVKIKWMKLSVLNEIETSIMNITVVRRPKLKSCFLLELIINNNGDTIKINQLCSSDWTPELMKEVVVLFDGKFK